MDLTLTETQQLIRSSMTEYLEREVPFSRVREVEAGSGFDDRLWQALAEQGWLGLPFPEAVGGSGGSLTDLAVLIEALTRRAVLIPILEAMAAAVTMQRYGDGTRELIARVIAGEMIPVPAILERSGKLDGGIAAEVRGGRLHGEKRFVDYAQQATQHLVAARDGGQIGLFLVDARDPGVVYSPLRTIGRVPGCNVAYNSVAATRIAGREAYEFLARLGRALAAIQCLACAQQALDMTVEYTGFRVQFGRPIGSFQAVQHHCADMATQVTACRYLTYEAVWSLDHGFATDNQLAVVKVVASNAATYVTMQAHQLHGGIGFIEEYDLYFSSLRGKQAALSWGSAEECLSAIGESIEEAEEWLPIRSADETLQRV